MGLATGATAVLVPERPVNFEEDIISKIQDARIAGRTHYMIIVAEGAGSASEIAAKLQEELKLDVRVTVLGHVQRGGTPSARDRVTATRMGEHAVQLLAAGKSDRIVCVQHGLVTDVDTEEGLAMTRSIMARDLEVLDTMTGI